tara:strand:+ start:992 stop:1237 length:246 start_codon:yes stop_codon:yes gene_type:complete
MVQRRFIAGAVCPRCGELDKIVVIVGDNDQLRECIRCGFSDNQPEMPEVQEPRTRVNRAKSRMIDTDTQVVQLVDVPTIKD